jgi:RES domain-containing protein
MLAVCASPTAITIIGRSEEIQRLNAELAAQLKNEMFGAQTRFITYDELIEEYERTLPKKTCLLLAAAPQTVSAGTAERLSELARIAPVHDFRGIGYRAVLEIVDSASALLRRFGASEPFIRRHVARIANPQQALDVWKGRNGESEIIRTGFSPGGTMEPFYVATSESCAVDERKCAIQRVSGSKSSYPTRIIQYYLNAKLLDIRDVSRIEPLLIDERDYSASNYLAQSALQAGVDGIIYPSTITTGGELIALFKDSCISVLAPT